MRIPDSTTRLVPRMKVETLQEIYRIYGLGGLTDHLNQLAQDFNNDLYDLTERTDFIPQISANEAYDTLRGLESLA